MDVQQTIVAIFCGLFISVITELGSRRIYRKFAKSPTPEGRDRFLRYAQVAVLVALAVLAIFFGLVLKMSPNELLVAAFGLLVGAIAKVWLGLSPLLLSLLNGLLNNMPSNIVSNVGSRYVGNWWAHRKNPKNPPTSESGDSAVSAQNSGG